MTAWDALHRELDIWHEQGMTATLWWRDDDAAAWHPALERLLDIGERYAIPLHLAVIPAAMTGEMVSHVKRYDFPVFLQHGFSHVDHAPSGQGSWELGTHRPVADVMNELIKGREELSAEFGERFIPVQVPPWTRISAEVSEALPQAGFKALSVEGARADTPVGEKLKVFNTHCDPIKWKNGARFKGVDKAIAAIVEHLQMRREDENEQSAPTGICTHHLAHGEDLWMFLDDYAAFTATHPAVRWISLKDCLA